MNESAMCNSFYSVLFTVILFFSTAAQAQDQVSVSVTGNILASPCKIDTDNLNQTIKLGVLVSSDLQKPGSAGPEKKFQIKFYDCPAGTSQVNLTFSGNPDNDEPLSSYKNDGSASNIFVRLMTQNNEPAGPGQVISGMVDADNAVNFDLSAQAVSKGEVIAGSIMAAATFTVTYS